MGKNQPRKISRFIFLGGMVWIAPCFRWLCLDLSRLGKIHVNLVSAFAAPELGLRLLAMGKQSKLRMARYYLLPQSEGS